jgi:hypothetical protein
MTEGAKPYTMKVIRTVFNGGDEETGLVRPRLVATQRECGFFVVCAPGYASPHVCLPLVTAEEDSCTKYMVLFSYTMVVSLSACNQAFPRWYELQGSIFCFP